MLPVLLTLGLGLGISAAAQPGPFQAYLLAQSIRNGAARTLPVAFVPLLSDPPVIAVVLAVLAQVPAALLRALQIGGGLVVLWLAWGTLRAAFAPPAAGGAGEGAGAPPRGILRAALVNFTNPNAWIFWSFVGGPTLASAWREAPARAALFLGGFYAALLAGGAALVLVASRAAALGPRFARGLGIVSGVALLGFGLVQLGRGIAG